MSANLGDLAARYRAACAALGLPVWRPGMRYFISDADGNVVTERVPEDTRAWLVRSSAVPDFNDPATIGCLLAAAREAWPEDRGQVLGTQHIPHRTKRSWRAFFCAPVGYGDTEAEALIAALETAAERKT